MGRTIDRIRSEEEASRTWRERMRDEERQEERDANALIDSLAIYQMAETDTGRDELDERLMKEGE